MSGSLPTLRVDIVAKDTTGPVLDRANKRLMQTGQLAEKAGKSTAKLGETSAITRLSEGMHTLSLSSGDVFRAVSKISPAMQGITGAVTLAGMTTLVQRWGQFGQQLRNTSLTIGVPVNKITALSGAAKQLGVGADTLTSGLDTLQEKMRGAAFNRDPEAIRTFNQLGIAFKDSSGSAREAGDAFGDVADAIKKKYDTLGRGAALRATDALGLHDLFPLLIKGHAGIRALEQDTKNLGGTITPGMAQRAQDLAQSFERVEIAVTGVGNHLADDLAPAATRWMNGATELIRKNPEVAKSFAEIGASLTLLMAIKPSLLVARLLGISAVATPAALASPLLLHGDTDPNATAAGAPSWASPGGFLGRGGGLERWWGGIAPTWLGGNPAPHGAGISVPKPGTAAFDVMKKTHDFWISKGFTEKQVAGIMANVAAESGFNPGSVGDGGTSYGLYQHHGSRMAGLLAKYGAHPTVEQQNEYAYDELTNPSRSGTLAALRAAPTSANPAAIFTSGFEVPADTTQTAMRRAGAAGKFEGAVDVNVHLHGAPPGTRATATGSGNVNVSPPRVETAMPAH
jgi:hypothetical protein